MKRRLCPLAIILLIFSLVACNQTAKQDIKVVHGLSKDTLEAALDAVRNYVDDGKLAGVSVMVIKDGETVLEKQYGYADLAEKQPIDDQTIFRAFSMTKPITAAALMILYDEGKFQLDDKVADYIPEFGNTQVYNSETKTLEPQEKPMTIRNLLTHTSGLTYGWDMNSYVDSLYRVSGASGWNGVLADKMKELAEIPLKYQPGTKWEYGLSIDVVGYLVEILSEMPLDEFFRTRIYDPLKMDDSGFYVPEAKHDRFARIYSKDENGNLISPENGMQDNFKRPATLFSGGGGSVATVEDYSRFAQMLLNGGEFEGARILNESTVKMMMSDQLPKEVTYEETGGYGLGGSYNIENGQYGWSGAASTFFTVDTKNNMIVLAFTQFMPFDISYALEFNKIVHRAIVE
ncbi:serine hydrolase domain-containing protein [Maribellus maritimus]|uniref:serine hydrolase domain-containing protein n=1 Tax=Maribellus maritimus TaxID=2870838 RepID=UPI001EE9C3B1|nr:serine hydrolase domain-containing protein [Maribellus maritimus]MCG6189292.1 beta-lactamase family protein [Maribellus maritimus]